MFKVLMTVTLISLFLSQSIIIMASDINDILLGVAIGAIVVSEINRNNHNYNDYRQELGYNQYHVDYRCPTRAKHPDHRNNSRNNYPSYRGPFPHSNHWQPHHQFKERTPEKAYRN